MTEQEKQAFNAKFDAALTGSTMSEATKQALRERQLAKVQEQAKQRAIYGLDAMTGSKRPKITLGNGLQVNADAFAD